MKTSFLVIPVSLWVCSLQNKRTSKHFATSSHPFKTSRNPLKRHVNCRLKVTTKSCIPNEFLRCYMKTLRFLFQSHHDQLRIARARHNLSTHHSKPMSNGLNPNGKNSISLIIHQQDVVFNFAYSNRKQDNNSGCHCLFE